MHEIFTVANLFNLILAMIAFGIKNELRHINNNIDSVKELVEDAKSIALRAHERIDFFHENKRH